MDYVRHEEPNEFERKGAAIVHCPCCKSREVPLSEEERAHARDQHEAQLRRLADLRAQLVLHTVYPEIPG